MPEEPHRPEDVKSPHQPPKRGWGLGQWLVVGLLGFLLLALAGLSVPGHGPQERGRQMQAMNNCRQIIISLKSYASDHGGKYPEGATANDAFRQLMKEGLLEDERIFSSPTSPFVGDNNIGEAPNYAEAMQAGENHWAMTKGLTVDSPGDWPVVFENPAQASWPPRWDGRLVGVAKSGRVWKKDKIIVGRNDGSMNTEKLTRDGNPLITLEPVKDGKNLFELAGPHEVLDVVR